MPALINGGSGAYSKAIRRSALEKLKCGAPRLQTAPGGRTSSLKPTEKQVDIQVRLDQAQARAITEAIAQSDPAADVFLFGSRVDDTKRGGDIDLLIMSAIIDADERRRIKLRLDEVLGAQKIDLLVARNDEKPMVRIALREGVRL